MDYGNREERGNDIMPKDRFKSAIESFVKWIFFLAFLYGLFHAGRFWESRQLDDGDAHLARDFAQWVEVDSYDSFLIGTYCLQPLVFSKKAMRCEIKRKGGN